MALPLPLQAAPFTAEEAALYGVSRHRLRSLASARRVVRLFRNVYVSADVVLDLEDRAAAAARLVLPEFAVICDRTAAWIHGVDVLEHHELILPPILDVVVRRQFTRRRRGEMTPRVRDLDDADVMQIGSISVTTPLRTSADLGCQLRPRSALAAMDQFARHHGVTSEVLEIELPRYRGRRGVIQLRRLIPLVHPGSESPGESWVRMAIIDAGLPEPVVQHVIEAGHRTIRLDLAYPRLKICIEYDGVEFHTAEIDRAADAERRAWLRARGWIVIVVTQDDWDVKSLERWTGELRAAIAERRRPASVRRFAISRAGA